MQQDNVIRLGDLVYCNHPKMDCQLRVVRFHSMSIGHVATLHTVDPKGKREACNRLVFSTRYKEYVEFQALVSSLVKVQGPEIEYIELYSPSRED